ncbi:hypothetical protein BRADI_4g38227v3 [Brachypodium distachyon]|uniref:Uncharacterized protein n=1 Tax=Brachypodium distachyon TaxID=15368 RepID=A0A2K2CT39_BRADI|nr:hypothetical protein BRADI_4g38227v3 [Brachypodium distachyon]
MGLGARGRSPPRDRTRTREIRHSWPVGSDSAQKQEEDRGRQSGHGGATRRRSIGYSPPHPNPLSASHRHPLLRRPTLLLWRPQTSRSVALHLICSTRRPGSCSGVSPSPNPPRHHSPVRFWSPSRPPDFASVCILDEQAQPWVEGDPQDLQQLANFLRGACGLVTANR